MIASTVIDRKTKHIYEMILKAYPQYSPDAIEASIQCLQTASFLVLKREQLCNQYGITPGRLSVLVLLWSEPKKMLLPSELAEQARVTRATVTHFIDGLEKDQLVRRVDHPTDRRAMWIEITQKGEDLLNELLPAHLERLSQVSMILTREERNQLKTLMEKLGEGILLLEDVVRPEK